MGLIRAVCLLFFSFFSLTAFAELEIMEASSNGPTYIDPINSTTYINYKTNYQYTKPKVSYAKCPRNAQGEVLKNYFIYKKKDANGVFQNVSTLKLGLSCEQIKQENGDVPCEEHTALEMSIDDPVECQQGNCPKLTHPRVATLPIRLSNENLQKELDTCSPGNQFIIIRDKVRKGLFASLADKSHCKLEKRRILTPGALWDDNESPLTKIFTSNKSGFYIGEHTHYYYDESKKQWCLHFRPDIGTSSPTCGHENTTKSIAFALPAEDKKFQKGVVKLMIDKDGKPSAIIGHPKSSEYSKNPELDESKPLLKVNISNNEKEGRRVTFDAMSSLSATTPLRSINVAPTYSMGSNVNQPGTCDKTACLDAVKEVLAPDTTSPLQCSNSSEPFTMPGNGQTTCYSCNGISSGTCGSEKIVLTKSNVQQYADKIKTCQSNAAPTEPEEMLSPSITPVEQ
jgi:hypothetical protein